VAAIKPRDDQAGGAGGIGQVLIDSTNTFSYSETGCIVLVIVVAVSGIDLLSQAIRSRLM
jgi:phosphonate transport system permease protein